MRKFIYRTGLFLAVGLMVVSGYHTAIYRLLLANPQHYAVDDEITTIVIGDSHTETSIDGEKLQNVQNFSFRGETLYFSYYKLKRILDVNPQIENVLLSFSYHSLNEFHDDVPPEFLFQYYWLLDMEGLNKIDPTLHDAALALKDMSGRLYQWLLSRIENTRFHLLNGGYRKLEVNNLSAASSEKRISGHYFKDNSNEFQEQSTLQTLYLTKLLQLGIDRNIRLIFINTPLHHSYYDNIPEQYISRYYSRVKGISKRNPDVVTLLDLRDAVADDKYFHDGDHLNAEGGVYFMKILNEKLRYLSE